MIYDRLVPGLQRWLEFKNWRSWTQIQEAAMPLILDGHGALLIAPTASGKTEAALLPIISRIAEDRLEPIALIYVSPLRALINDQTRRAQMMLEENGLGVAWWHGDLGAAARKKVLADPPHALFTTPESLEVILSSDAYGHGALLGNARFVLIDEIHAFAGDDRGAQLMSVLARIESGIKKPLLRVALSATVSSPEGICAWMKSTRSDAPIVHVVKDQGTRARRIGVGCLAFAPTRHGRLDADAVAANDRKLTTVVGRHVSGKRAIVFVRSRADAERLTFNLNEAGVEAMVHHGSIAKEERARVEDRFRVEGPKVIVATSTLELGIDIGDMELVLQIGAPSSASSLLQRLGRSGRRKDVASVCIVYAENIGELPECLAAAELALEGTVEPVYPFTTALHVLFHQVIQLLRERERATAEEIGDVLLGAGSFTSIDAAAYADLIEEMTQMGYLEQERDWLRTGATTERDFGLMNYRNFYSVFETDVEWTVRTEERIIGSLSRTFPVPKGRETFVVLAGRAWRIINVDAERLVLIVEPATRMNIPAWQSAGPGATFEVMQRAYAILCGTRGQLETDPLTEKLASDRDDAAKRGWASDLVIVSPDKDATEVTTFFGSDLNAYVATLLMGSASDVHATATATTIRVRGASTTDVAQAMRRIFVDKSYRGEALERALPHLTQTRIGRYWPNLGPKTQARLLRAYFLAGENALARTAHFGVTASPYI